MKEIDKRIKEKINMFDEIDKMVNMNTISRNGAKTNRNLRHLSINSNYSSSHTIDRLKQPQNMQAKNKTQNGKVNNKSDSENKLCSYSTSINNISNPLSNNNSNNNINGTYNTSFAVDEGKNGNNHTCRNIRKDKDMEANSNSCQSVSSSMASGDRLYENSKVIRAKLESKRIQNEIERKRNMTPNITNKSKKIERDPQLFGERLYPYHKIANSRGGNTSMNTSMQIKKSRVNSSLNGSVNDNSEDPDLFFKEDSNIEQLYGNDSLINVYRKAKGVNYDNFDHIPKLDKKSLKMAEKMEPSMTRLTTKKKKTKSIDKFINIASKAGSLNNSREHLYNDYINNNEERKNINLRNIYANLNANNFSFSKSDMMNNSMCSISNSQRSLNRSKEMYDKALESIRKRQQAHLEKKEKEENAYKNFPYKPNTNKLSKKPSEYMMSLSNGSAGDLKRSNSTVSNYLNNSSSFYDKNNIWKNSINKRSEMKKTVKEKEAQKLCTFTPQIKKKEDIPPADVKCIMRNQYPSMEYINRRRRSIQKYEEDKEYARKKLQPGKDFIIKQTIPKKFAFNKSKSRKSLITPNEPKLLHNVQSVNVFRKKLKTEIYFHDGSFSSSFLNINPVSNPSSNANLVSPSSRQLEEESSFFLENGKLNKSLVSNTDKTNDIYLSAVSNLSEKMVKIKLK